MAFSLLTNIYLAKTLSIENFGVYNISLNLMYIFLILAEWGQNMIGTREVALLIDKSTKNKLLSEIVTFKAAIVLIITPIYIIIVHLFYPDFWLTLLIPLIQLIATPFILDWFFQAERKFYLVAFRQAFLAAAAFLLTISLVDEPKEINLSIFIYNFSIFSGTLIVFLLGVNRGYQTRYVISRMDFITRLKQSSLYFISIIVTACNYSLGLVILGIFSSTEVAIYSTYYRIFSSLVAPALITYNIFLPLLIDGTNEKTTEKYLFILTNTAFFIVYCSLFLGPEFYSVIYGAKYLFDEQIFFKFLGLIVVHFLNYYYLYLLLAKKADAYFLTAVCSGLALNLALVSIFYVTNSLNASSIAGSLLLAETLSLALGMSFLKRHHSKANFRIPILSLPIFLFIVATTKIVEKMSTNHITLLATFVTCAALYACFTLIRYKQSYMIRND